MLHFLVGTPDCVSLVASMVIEPTMVRGDPCHARIGLPIVLQGAGLVESSPATIVAPSSSQSSPTAVAQAIPTLPRTHTTSTAIVPGGMLTVPH